MKRGYGETLRNGCNAIKKKLYGTDRTLLTGVKCARGPASNCQETRRGTTGKQSNQMDRRQPKFPGNTRTSTLEVAAYEDKIYGGERGQSPGRVSAPGCHEMGSTRAEQPAGRAGGHQVH